MTVTSLIQHWRKYLFEPQSPIPLALFRIFLGLLLLESHIIHVGENVLVWYGPHAVTSFDSVKTFFWKNYPSFDIFALCPQSDLGILALWLVNLLFVFFMTIGLWTRISSIAVCLFLLSMHNHQPWNIHNGDAMMRYCCTYMMFGNAGAALSVDRLVARFHKPVFGAEARAKKIVPWAQRMIQLQFAIGYWSTECHKISGKQWLDGTAIFWVTRAEDFKRFALPINNMLVSQCLTYFTLFVEGAMFTLVWLKDLRYYILACAVALHLGIEYTMNIPVFEWVFMAGLLTFVYPEDLTRCMDKVKQVLNQLYGPPTRLTFCPQESLDASLASVIEGLDIFGRLEIQPRNESISDGLRLEYPTGEATGFSVFAKLTACLPSLWPFFLIFGAPFNLLNRLRSRGHATGHAATVSTAATRTSAASAASMSTSAARTSVASAASMGTSATRTSAANAASTSLSASAKAHTSESVASSSETAEKSTPDLAVHE